MRHKPIHIQHKINFKSQAKKYTPGIIEAYIKKRNLNWLNDNPPCSEETKKQIRELYETTK